MSETIDAEMEQMIRALWERSKDQVSERLRLLDCAATAHEQGEMGDEFCAEALEIAHKLAGSLGMFGFVEAGKIARRLEALLKRGDPDPEQMVELVRRLRESLWAPE